MAKHKPKAYHLWRGMSRSQWNYTWRMMIACLCVLTTISSIGNAAICTGTIPGSYVSTSIGTKFTGSSTNVAIGIVSGPISKSLYYMYMVTAGSINTAIRKIKTDGTTAWMIGNTLSSIEIPGFSVDLTETNVYILGGTGGVKVVRLSASDGTIAGQYTL